MGKTKAIETTEELAEILQSLMTVGLDETLSRFDLSEDIILDALRNNGLSDQQVEILRESSAFRSGLFADGTIAVPPQLQSVLDNIQTITTDTINSLQPSIDSIITRGGRTDLTGQAGDRARDIAQGRLPGQVAREEVGLETLGQRGQTEGTRTVRDRGTELINTRGMAGFEDLQRTVTTAADVVSAGGASDKTNAIFEFGANLLAANGFTPEVKEAFNFAIESLNNPNAASPELMQAISDVNRIISSEGSQGAGIMPINEFLGFARADAANTSLQVARAAQEDAVRRGLLPGAVSSGTEAGDLAGDAILRNEGETTYAAVSENQRLRAGAVSDAFRNLTNLLAIQRDNPNVAAFAGILSQAIGASTENIRSGASLTTNAAALENERFRDGLAGVIEGSRIFAGREATGFNAVLAADNAELQRMAFGADLLAQNTAERFQGIGAMMDVNAQEQQSLFNAMNMQLAAGTFGVNSNISAGNLVLANQGQAMDAFLSSLGLSADVAQAGQNNMFSGAQLLNNQGANLLSFAQTGMNNFTQAQMMEASLRNQPGFWQRLLQQGIGLAAGVAAPWLAGQFGPTTSGSSLPGVYGGAAPSLPAAPPPTGINPNVPIAGFPEIGAPAFAWA